MREAVTCRCRERAAQVAEEAAQSRGLRTGHHTVVQMVTVQIAAAIRADTTPCEAEMESVRRAAAIHTRERETLEACQELDEVSAKLRAAERTLVKLVELMACPACGNTGNRQHYNGLNNCDDAKAALVAQANLAGAIGAPGVGGREH